MLELLNSILQFIISIRKFITSTIKSLMVMIASIPQYVNFISTAVSVLPPFVLPFRTCSIRLSVLIFITNKD